MYILKELEKKKGSKRRAGKKTKSERRKKVGRGKRWKEKIKRGKREEKRVFVFLRLSFKMVLPDFHFEKCLHFVYFLNTGVITKASEKC